MPDISFSPQIGKVPEEGKSKQEEQNQAKEAKNDVSVASSLHPAAANNIASVSGVVSKKANTGYNGGVTRLILNLLIVLVSIALVVGVFVLGKALQAQAESQKGVLSQKEASISRLEREISKEQSMQSARLGRLSAAVQDIHMRSMPWTKIIAAVEDVMPPEAAIFSYSGRYIHDDRSQVGRNIISVQGVADSYSRIAEIIDALEGSSLFSNVKFEGSSKSITEDESEEVQVKLSFDLAKPELSKDELAAITSPNVVNFGEDGGDSVSLAPLDLRAPLPPVGLAAKSMPISPMEGKIQLTWQKTTGLEQGNIEQEAIDTEENAKKTDKGMLAAVGSYIVRIAKRGESDHEKHIVVVSNPSYPTYSFTFLTTDPRQEYEFSVIAKDIAGRESGPSKAIIARAADDMSPAQPQFILSQIKRSLSLKEEFKEEVHLVWQMGDLGEEDIYRYRLYVGVDPDDLRLLAVLNKNVTSYDYTDQVTSGSLYFRIIAEDTSGNVSTSLLKTIKLEAGKTAENNQL